MRKIGLCLAMLAALLFIELPPIFEQAEAQRFRGGRAQESGLEGQSEELRQRAEERGIEGRSEERQQRVQDSERERREQLTTRGISFRITWMID